APSPAPGETRVPQITRESTSRPTLSVPRRWARPGLARTLPRSCLRGAWGDTTGASTATTRAASITTTPRGARRGRAACRSTAHRRALTGGAAAGAASAADPVPRRRALGPRRAELCLGERLQHAGAERARDHGGHGQPQRDGGQHERAQAQPRLLQGVGIAGDGEPAKLDAEEEDEEEAEEKVGHEDAEQGERGAHAEGGG